MTPAPLEARWRWALYGSGVGKAGIHVCDLDSDGTNEIVTAAQAVTSAWGRNCNFWYVVKRRPEGWAISWFSEPTDDVFDITIGSLEVGDTNADGSIEIFVALSNGLVAVHDGRTFQQKALLEMPATRALKLADVDGDGSTDVIGTDGTKIFVRSGAPPYSRKWTLPAWGGERLEVGNVDDDPSPEIVTSSLRASAHVVDGATRQLEWDRDWGFGGHLALCDTDHDGVKEILAGLDEIEAWSARTKSLLWKIPATADGLLEALDVDGDGLEEIVAGPGQPGRLQCFNAGNRLRLWSIATDPVFGADAGDLDGQGGPEIVWGAMYPDLLIAEMEGAEVIWHDEAEPWLKHAVALKDVDDDGSLDRITIVGGDVLRVQDPATNAIKWQVETGHPFLTFSVGDVDDDGTTEVVLPNSFSYDDQGVLEIYDGPSGQFERRTPSYDMINFTSIEVGDADNDGHTDIVAGSGRVAYGFLGVRLFVFDGATAEETWRSNELTSGIGLVEGYDIELADVDSDGRTDMVASFIPTIPGVQQSTLDSAFFIWDTRSPAPRAGSGVRGYPALETGDVDRDGTLEILVGQTGFIGIYSGVPLKSEIGLIVGQDPVYGLALRDLDRDGRDELLATSGSDLLVMANDSGRWELKYLNETLGWWAGLFNFLDVADTDRDGTNEIVTGSYFARYRLSLPDNFPPVLRKGAWSEGVPGVDVVLDVGPAADPDGRIERYDWDFDGDGRWDFSGDTPRARTVYRMADSYSARVSATDDSGNRTEAVVPVKILDKRIVVLSPNGGETHHWGDEILIDWDALPSVDNVTIQISTNGGKSWQTLTSLRPAHQHPLSTFWPSSMPSTDRFLARVIGCTEKGKRTGSDTSDGFSTVLTGDGLRTPTSRPR